ncbi:prospero homeobox protein 1-like [Micropterus salmoides]|uniref:prospero homeobox protein 1-like n=1 Tax=Micropterus salmoides TaxID=27706 RepID=UPI0018EB4A43|nr:prospero homeobox protein 1-like [Micropterus salmoides]
MNPSVWSKGMYSSSNICLDGCPAERLSSFQSDPVPSNSDASGASVTLHKDSENIKMLPESVYYSSCDAGSMICSRQLKLNPSRDTGYLSARRHPSPASSSCGRHDWYLNSGRRAKRARVENIIKGMTGSPGMHCTDDNERIQDLPLHQEHMERNGSGSARKQLDIQHQHLRQLRTRFNHVDGVTETTDSTKEEQYPTWNDSPEASPRDARTNSYSEFESSPSRKDHGWKKVKLFNFSQSKPERTQLMADVLKYELSRAVNRSVDTIFKRMPRLQTSPNDERNVETDVPLHSSVCKDNNIRQSCCGNAAVHVPGVQTEALSLVVQKPRSERADKSVLQSESRAHHGPKPPIPLSHDSALREDQLPEKNHNTAPQHALGCLPDGCSEVGQAKFERFDAHWNSVKVRTKVNSRCVRSPQTHSVSVDPMFLQSLCLPHVKIESDSLVKNNLYMLNEGLTTNHLKKAKLIFFYTRYPSSLVLKMCFHDVQFTRCITSQLIKWFSNFREFYYIQMEKFARHALTEGVADVRGLTVGRESELFRALNMHYNKANDFQVPNRFLEVAEITLREFYVAISMGKDRDPSWKKAIYKVICKLDSEVPAEFKHHRSER